MAAGERPSALRSVEESVSPRFAFASFSTTCWRRRSGRRSIRISVGAVARRSAVSAYRAAFDAVISNHRLAERGARSVADGNVLQCVASKARAEMFAPIDGVANVRRLERRHLNAARLKGGRHEPSAPKRGQLAPPSAKSVASGWSVVVSPFSVKRSAPSASQPSQVARVRISTPCAPSRASQARSNGEAFIALGNTRPLEPMKVLRRGRWPRR